MAIFFILAIILLAGIISVFIYNKLVQLNVLVQEAFSGIDVQLKRRHDLIPNIIETVKGYSAHERGVLEKVTTLRSQIATGKSIKDTQTAENQLSAGLRSIFALVENYPDLKADKNFQELQKSLTAIEDELQMARRYYNGTVRNLNILIQSFPINLLAQWLHFQKAPFFEIEYATERQTPDIKFDH